MYRGGGGGCGRGSSIRVLDATFSPARGFDAAAAKYRHRLLASA